MHNIYIYIYNFYIEFYINIYIEFYINIKDKIFFCLYLKKN